MTSFLESFKQGFEINYLLMDSWFFCEAFLKLLTSLKTKIGIVAMVKMAKAKYAYQDKTYTAKAAAPEGWQEAINKVLMQIN